jgi:hypothetical protein
LKMFTFHINWILNDSILFGNMTLGAITVCNLMRYYK